MLGGDVGNHENVTRCASGEDLGPGYASVVIGIAGIDSVGGCLH